MMAKIALGFVPPLIRKSLLKEKSYREKYGLKTEAIIALEDGRSSFKRAELFDAVRSVFHGDGESEIFDTNGIVWNIQNEVDELGLPKFVLSSAEQRLILPNLSILSNESSIRIRSLEESSSDLNLPIESQKKWHSILKTRPLNDDEVDQYYSDLLDTPVHKERCINSEIREGPKQRWFSCAKFTEVL